MLGLCCAGAAISLSQHLPDGATHAIADRQVWRDFVGGGGTAMSPPLPIMVLFAAAIAASASRRWVGTLGAVTVAVGGIAFTIGIAIEPITLRVLNAHPDGSRPADRPSFGRRTGHSAGRRTPFAPAPEGPASEIRNAPLPRGPSRCLTGLPGLPVLSRPATTGPLRVGQKGKD